jgi:superoxide dismutase, Fe-Mn family
MEANRRNFIKTAGIAVAGAVAVSSAGRVIADSEKKQASGERTSHVLPELPYSYDALEPYIDKETMTLHHTMHHKAYVDGLNKAEEQLAQARASEDFGLVEYWSKKAAFNGGGHYLHSLFWENMASPHTRNSAGTGGKEPRGTFRKKIAQDFGSFESFKKHFSAAAVAVEGSGWAILHCRPADNRLIILQAENQHKLTSWGVSPVLVLDVWEHAYYLSYKNKRGAYVDAWWNLVNWEVVERRYAEKCPVSSEQ